MGNDDGGARILRFGKRWTFPADLQRYRRMLDDEEAEFEDSELEDGLACAEAAIAKGVPGADAVRAELATIRGYRTHHAGDVDGALAQWAGIIERFPDHRQAYVARASALEERGEHDAAMAELNRWVERSPTDAQGYLHRAKLHASMGDAQRALANYRRATQLDGTLTEAHLEMAMLLEKMGNATGAARAYEKAAEQPCGDAEEYGMRGFMHFVSGQEELALADYENAVALDPNDADALSWRALLRSREGQVDAALADYTRLISMRPEEARYFRRRGETLLRAGKPVEALRDLDRAVALGGNEGAAAHYARGRALAALGDVDAAHAAYDTASEHDTSRLLAHARALRSTQTYDDTVAAVFVYDRLVALEPGNAAVHKERSEALVGAGDTLAACESMARAFELAPDDPEIRASHGCNQAMRAKSDEERAAALALIASSVERDAHDPEAWARAASCFYRTAHGKAEAVRFISRAIELAPDVPGYIEARAYYELGAAPPAWRDPEGHAESARRALADLERALELCTDEDDEQRLREHRSELRAELGA